MSARKKTNTTLKQPEPQKGPTVSPAYKFREIFDELVFVIVLVMFLRLFIVELYKIPTGSMTPTLLGGTVAQLDLDNDGDKDLVYKEPKGNGALVFTWEDDRFLYNNLIRPNLRAIDQRGLFHHQYNRILVNKFVYWFRQPRRGNVVVFKTPQLIFDPNAPIYVKRLVGEPGDILTFNNKGYLVANGKLVTEPNFFRTQYYRNTVNVHTQNYFHMPNVKYSQVSMNILRLDKIDVPQGSAYVFGDNTNGSLDSRYWGSVPLDNFKGQAFLRITWPLKGFKLLG